MSELEELRGILDNTAHEIARVDGNPRTWLTSLIYLLERLEQKEISANTSYRDTYKEMLLALRDAIRSRLNTGGW